VLFLDLSFNRPLAALAKGAENAEEGAFLPALWNAKPIPLGRLYQDCLSAP